MYWFLVDILLLVIVVITTVLSIKRGFIASLVRVVGVFFAIFVAVIASRVFSEAIFTSLFRESLVSSVMEKISGALSIEQAAEALKTGFIGLLIGVFGDVDKLTAFFIDTVWQSDRILAEKIVDGVIKDPFISLIKIVVFLLAFSLAVSLVVLIVKISGMFNSVPIIGGVNKVFGALLGVIYGIGICLCITGVISFLLVVTDTNEANRELIDNNSYILSYLINRINIVILS